MWRKRWLASVCFAPDGGGGGNTPTIESLQTELAAAKARITELNQENAGHRLNAKNEKARADDLAGKLEAAATEAKLKLEAVEAKLTEAAGRATQAQRDAALKIAAKEAGIKDLDGLKLLDTSKIEVDADGIVKIPDKFFETAKAAKPWLFGEHQSSNPTPPPPPKPTNEPVNVKKMTPDEYKAAKAAALA